MKPSVLILAGSLATLATVGGCAHSERGMVKDTMRERTSSTADYDNIYGATASTASERSAKTPSGSATLSPSAADTSPSATAGTSAKSPANTSASSGTSMASAPSTWSGVVTAIDPILRQDAAAMGIGSVGAAAVGGTMAKEGGPTDRIYRVTLRADDGTTQTVTVESMPSYKTGDRVRYSNGSVQRE